MRVLFFGDVVGKPGRAAIDARAGALRERHDADVLIANGENSAGGIGITEATADELFDAGIDLITTGNHVYRHRNAYEFLDRSERVVRPANYPLSNPGRGSTLFTVGERRLGVLNLSGAVSLQVARSPFAAADAELAELERRGAEAVIVDFHAEVTSEKVALGWHLDGRVAAVLGTHTHVPTADARVLPGGTAHVTDVGMCGGRGGVLGVRHEGAVEALRTGMPVRFETSDEDVWINAVVVEIGPDGLARSIEQVLEPVG